MGILTKAAVAVLAYESAHALWRFHERKEKFAQAQARALALKLPLVVVGDPDSGLHTRILRAYSCGDLCVDIHGCPACTPNDAIVDLTTEKIPVPDGGAVIFESCVLEYVDDLAPAWAELMRAAGSLDNLFTVRVSRFCLTSRIFGGAKWILRPAVAEGHRYRATRISDDTRDGSQFLGMEG